jgi:hypothetical protein
MTEAQWALVQLLDGVQRHDLPNQTGLPDDEIARIWSAYESARAALAQPVPVGEGEVGELVSWLRENAEDERQMCESTNRASLNLDRAADLLAQRHPAPVPVSERLQQMEDLAADAVSALRYVEQSHGRLYGVGWDRVYEKADRLLPAHALPLPAGEVQP